ncbi:MFS transporter [Streptomyces sp. MS19]|uniref:MFS transporter n=1 Tax=Streptomyces sp. MS19 TaxID=3385972 RepID=UPI0039A2F587
MSTELTQPTASAPPGLGARLGVVLAVCCLAQFLVTSSVAVVNVALPSMRESGLGFTADSLQWIVNAYTVAFAGFLLLGGRVADFFGRRRVLLAGVLVFTVASLAAGVAPSAGVLIAARAVQGLAAAVIAPTTLAVLGTSFTDVRSRHRAFGAWGAVSGAGGAFGALAGGVLTDALSWRWIFFVNVPVGLVLLAGAAWVVTELRHHHGTVRELDLLGAVTVTAAVLLAVLGIVQGGPKGWTSAASLGPLVAGVVLLALFLLIEHRWAPSPLLPLDVFKSRSVSAANVVALTSGAALFGTFYFLTLYLSQVRDYSPLRTGFAYLPLAVAIMVAAQFCAPLIRAVGPRTTLVLGMVLSAGGLFWLGRLTEGSSFAGGVLGPTLALGVGQGISMSATAIAGVAGVPARRAGLASGLLNAARQLGGAVGLAVLAAVAAARVTGLAEGGVPGPHAYASGYGLAFTVAGVLALAGALTALAAPGGTPRRGGAA